MVSSKVGHLRPRNLEKENDINFANIMFRDFCERECAAGFADICVYLDDRFCYERKTGKKKG
jgi:hypothetical protein